MPPIVSEGLSLMSFGMGTVFVFLIVLILATQLMSTWVLRFLPEPAAEREPQESLAHSVDPALLKVISLAVKEHRSQQ